MKDFRVHFWVGMLAFLMCAGPCRAQDAPSELNARPFEPVPAGEAPAAFMRANRKGSTAATIRLEVAVRELIPAKGSGPSVWLVSAVHVGDRDYYDRLQEFLDAQSLVLYEGVGRPSFMDRDEADDDTRASRTRSAVAFLSMLVDWYRAQFGPPPLSMRTLQQAVRQHRKQEAKPLSHALIDGWGVALRYQREKSSYSITSYGSDGEPGGEGHAADIVHDGGPIAPAPQDQGFSLQGEMATALGLVFQLEGIDYEREHFLNSDMSLKRIQSSVNDATEGDSPNASMEALISAMEGRGAVAAIAKVALTLVRASPQLREMVKLVLIEAIGQIQGDLSKMQGMVPQMEALMRVLIQERNQIVVDDLQFVLSQKDDKIDSIAIFYGAAHLADLEQRIAAQLKYRPHRQFWLTAFEADIAASGLSEQQLEQLRAMLKQSLMQGAP